jgi:hypothetical protein
VTDEDEALRLRRELADAKVEQLQARLAELHASVPQTPVGSQQVLQQVQARLAELHAEHPELNMATPLATASPQATAALHAMLDRVGLGAYVPKTDSWSTDASTPVAPVLPLSAPPRHVPFAYRLFVLPWSTWMVFTLFMIGVSPLAVWIFWPIVGVVVASVVFLGILVLALRKYLRLMGLLRWGQQATSVQALPVSVGTYYSGTTYQNMRLPIAHGWKVSREFYSGPGTKTKLRYQLDTATGELTLRGREYIDGAILVNSRKPEVAACVTSIPFDLSERTPSGDWTGRVRVGTIIGAVAMFIVVFGWAAVMIYVLGKSAASMDQLPFVS